MRGTLSTLSPWVLTFGGALWTAKGLGATLAPLASLEPLYAFGFLGGMILFFIALGLAVAGRADAGRGTWIAALLMTLIVTLLLVSVGGSMRSTGRTWYGVEVPIVLSGLIWAVLGVARSTLMRSKGRAEIADLPLASQQQIEKP